MDMKCVFLNIAKQISKLMVSVDQYDQPGFSWHDWRNPRPQNGPPQSIEKKGRGHLGQTAKTKMGDCVPVPNILADKVLHIFPSDTFTVTQFVVKVMNLIILCQSTILLLPSGFKSAISAFRSFVGLFPSTVSKIGNIM